MENVQQQLDNAGSKEEELEISRLFIQPFFSIVRDPIGKKELVELLGRVLGEMTGYHHAK